MPMKRTSLFLDDNLLKKLKRVAARDGVSIASLVREAVSRYLAEPQGRGSVPSIAGRFASGFRDTGGNPDEFLWRDPHG